MGVKKTMDTFFASMQEQSMAGYGGRLVNTPMGPFRWNDTIQLWENVNNGMVMNNISFQDSIMMLDYSTIDGGSDGIVAVIPGGDPNLVLYLNFAASAIGPVTYSRGGTASFIDSDREIAFIGANTPRFNYYPNGTSVGLLIENFSTNLLLYSQAFDNAYWSKSPDVDGEQTIEITTDGPSPSGALDATLMIAKGSCSSAQHAIFSSVSNLMAIGGATGQTYSCSVWLKSVGNTLNRYFGLVAFNSNGRATFDLVGKTAQPHGPSVAAKLTEYKNDWYRAEMVWNLPTLETGFNLGLYLLSGFDDPIAKWSFSAFEENTSGIMIWGAQVENKPSASTYILTSGSTATRGNDLVHLSGTGFTWFNGNCGTFVLEFDRALSTHPTDVTKKTVMGMNYYNNISAFAIDYGQGNTLTLRAYPDTLNELFYLSPLTSGMNKVAFNYINDGSDFTITASLNGGSTTSFTDSNTSINFNGCTFMTLGYKQALVGTTAYDYLDTTIRSVQYWNKALSGASLQQLST